MEDAIQCFKDEEEEEVAAGRRGRRCPSYQDLTAMLTEKKSESDCFLESLGWIDENGEKMNTTVSEDIASLNPAIGDKITEEAIMECAMAHMEKMAKKPKYARCAKKYTEEQNEALGAIGMDMAAFHCFVKTFDNACKNHIKADYIEPLMESFNTIPTTLPTTMPTTTPI